MGKLYCLMGKSASGKDSLYRRVKELIPAIKGYVLYTTRPRRTDETDGIEYHFISSAKLSEYSSKGRLIELRTYKTVYGAWSYATIDDGQIALNEGDYLVPGTLDSFLGLRAFYGADKVVPIYIELDDGERLLRAVKREMKEKEPKYKELCRRFIADSEDFSEEHLTDAGIVHRFVNDDIDRCAEEIAAYIKQSIT